MRDENLYVHVAKQPGYVCDTGSMQLVNYGEREREFLRKILSDYFKHGVHMLPILHSF